MIRFGPWLARIAAAASLLGIAVCPLAGAVKLLLMRLVSAAVEFGVALKYKRSSLLQMPALVSPQRRRGYSLWWAESTVTRARKLVA